MTAHDIHRMRTNTLTNHERIAAENRAEANIYHGLSTRLRTMPVDNDFEKKVLLRLAYHLDVCAKSKETTAERFEDRANVIRTSLLAGEVANLKNG